MRNELDHPELVEEVERRCKAAGTFIEAGASSAMLLPCTKKGFWELIRTGETTAEEIWHGENLYSMYWRGKGARDLATIAHSVKELLQDGALFGWHSGEGARVYRKEDGRIRRVS